MIGVCDSCTSRTRRTDFPGGIIWWHDYEVLKRRGDVYCMPVLSFIAYPPFHLHIMLFPHPAITFICAPDTGMHISSIRLIGHAESLYIKMRDPQLSFSSRAKKTNKGSPPPSQRPEVCSLCRRLCVHSH